MSKAHTVNDAGGHPGVTTEHARGCNASNAAVTGRKANPLGLRSTARAAALWTPRRTAHAPSLEARKTVTAYITCYTLSLGQRSGYNVKGKKSLRTSNI